MFWHFYSAAENILQLICFSETVEMMYYHDGVRNALTAGATALAGVWVPSRVSPGRCSPNAYLDTF